MYKELLNSVPDQKVDAQLIIWEELIAVIKILWLEDVLIGLCIVTLIAEFKHHWLIKLLSILEEL